MTSVRQFDRERQAVETQHDFRDRVGVLVKMANPGTAAARSEQLRRLTRRDRTD